MFELKFPLSFSQIRNSHVLKKQNIAQATILITVFTFISKVVGYFRSVLVAKYFGATGQTDAFLIALIIPTLVMGLVSGGLNTLIIPVFIEKKRKDPKKAKIFINQIFFFWCIILLFLSLLLFLFTPFFVKLIAFGFKGARFDLAVQLTRYLIPAGFATVLIGAFTGIYQSQKQFLYPVIIGVIGNTLIVLSLILFAHRLGINSWTIGQLSYAIFSFLALILVLWKRWGFFRNFLLKNIYWQEIKHFFVLLWPLILTSGIWTLYNIVDKTIASSLQIGSIAILNFAQKTFLIPLSLLITPLVTAIYPTFSSLALDKKKNHEYADILQKAISLSWYIIIPISTIFIILSHPIVKFLFQRGAFTSQATNLTAITVSMYSIGLFAWATVYFLIKVFYSFKNTKVPLILSSITVIINIVGDIILSRIFGVAGIALATSISTIIGATVYFWIIKKKYFQKTNFKPLFKQALKIILISIPIGIGAFLSRPYFINSFGFIHLLIKLAIVSSILALLYLLLSYIFKIKEFTIIINRLKSWKQTIKARIK